VWRSALRVRGPLGRLLTRRPEIAAMSLRWPGTMRYRDDPSALAALVRDDAVHRDVYVDPEVYALEQARLWARSWVYVGHDSQVPRTGDCAEARIAGRVVTMTRNADGGVRLSMGGTAPAGVAAHRGFVFARLDGDGPDFEQWAGSMRRVLDDVADRSPQGALRVVGAPIRSLIRANWKTYVENINDTVHPPGTHVSANDAASAVWAGQPADAPKPMAIQQLLPFGSGYAFFERMGGRVLPHGHSILGTQASIHSAYDDLPGYADAVRAAHGEARAAQVLSFAPQNAVLYPSLSVKAMPTAIRVLRPLAVDLTLVEAWAFQPVGAPEALARRAVTYNRLVFSPMSVLSHDDVHVFQTIQQALRAGGNPWVSLHRGHVAPEREGAAADVGGTDERLIRNQFRAWARAMAG
jgi:hypothetical protein